MIYQAGIENNNEGRSIAWALEHPGCYAYGMNGKAAALNLESAIDKYARWIAKHGHDAWLDLSGNDTEIVINGTWEVYFIDDNLDPAPEAKGYSVESFFPYDWKPLTALEIKHARDMLTWTRKEVLDLVGGLAPEKLDRNYPGERWSIRGILSHLGGAEWWYLERLGLAFPRPQVPEEPLARLEKVRGHFNSVLPKLEGSTRVIGVDGEFWSPRKLLRRALWHERDHVEHITKLIAL